MELLKNTLKHVSSNKFEHFFDRIKYGKSIKNSHI